MQNFNEHFLGNFNSLKIEFLKPIVVLENDKLILNEEPFYNFSYYPEFIILNYKNGKKIYEEKRNVSSNSSIKTNFIYNSNDKLDEINIPDENSFYNQYKFSYNELNQKVKEEKFEYGNLKWTNFYIYDENGFLVKEEWRSRDYPIIDFIYRNDSQGNNVYKQGKYLLGQIETFEIVESEFDNKNRCVSKKTLDGFENFQYDDFGKVSVITANKKNETDKTIIKKFEYDEFQNPTKYLELENDEILVEKIWQYSYDDLNNWTKAIIYENKQPQVIIKRKFYL